MSAQIIILLLVPVAVVLVPLVLVPRIRMERRARALLAQHPGAQRTSVYLPFRSTFEPGKRREMEATIAAMASAGWTYLRATEANPLRTIRSSVNLLGADTTDTMDDNLARTS